MTNENVYQFNVILRDINPPIWRRFQVYSDITFYEFHRILQEVMGWYDSHLHSFEVDGMVITDAGTLTEIWEDGADEEQARLQEYVTREGQKIRYEYDFGDSWEHDVVLEKILSAEPNTYYPLCLAGKRACPPEDCGGVWGYADMLEALADADHPEHEMYLEWWGDDLDPEVFDLTVINEVLQKM